MDKIALTKTIVNFVVGGSVAFSARSSLKNNTTRDSAFQNAQANIAGIAVGVMAAEATDTWTDKKIDEIVLWWKENVNK